MKSEALLSIFCPRCTALGPLALAKRVDRLVSLGCPAQLERELSMVPNGFKKSKSKLGDGYGSTDRGELASDDACDPVKEKKILDKIVALKKRLVFWTRKMAECVYLKI